MNTKSKTKYISGVMSFLLLSVLCLAAQNPPSSSKAPAQSAQVGATTDKDGISSDYVIGLEDVLWISVWKEPDLSVRDLVVRPDGKISLPLINDIQASGLTAAQLQQQITEKLKAFVSSPVVSVTVTKVVSQQVSVVGEVMRPGAYPLGAPLTVLELLGRAGGFRETANPKKIKIMRKEGGKTIQFPLNFKDIAAGKNLEQNITLKNGDVVIVP